MDKRIAFASFLLLLALSLFVSAHEADFPHEEQLQLPPGLQKLKQYEVELASSITFLLALFAGIISFTSPCGFALLPAFFAVAFKDRKKSVLLTAGFSVGLIIALTIFGLIAGLLGDFLNKYKLTFAVVSGYILVLFGILLFLNTGFGLLNFKIDYKTKNSFFSTLMTGFFFGVGWTPCISPILAGIILLAANSGTVLNGTLLLFFYGIGIAIPLIMLALLSDKYDWGNSKLMKGKEIAFNLFSKRVITHTYNIIGGSLLAIIGVLMVIYKGTFFFQVDLPKYIPWSDAFWGYLSEKALQSVFFTSGFSNLIGIVIALSITIFIVWLLIKNRSGKNEN